MTEPKQVHRLRMQIKRKHPDWTSDMIRMEIGKFTKGSQEVHKSSQQNAKHQSTSISANGSQGVHNSSQKIFVKVDHSVRKGQYVISESMDGISFRYVGTISKGQPFERNGVIIIPTWHSGDGKEDGGISPAEAKSRIEKRWAQADMGGE